jgi:excinuclease ABC subunit A
MSKAASQQTIRIRGARQNNLKGFDLELPTRHLIVVTGLSGSGKSSLAFDTLYAEGQRRYIETFSPYARQFFDRMDKPRVDAIEGIPPAIALEQRNSVRTTRSTVGTMTEVCDHMKVLWPHLARLHCRQCGLPVAKESPQIVWDRIRTLADALPHHPQEALVTFELPLSAKLDLPEQLGLVTRQGFQRIWLDGNVARLDESAESLAKLQPPSLHVVQDRVRLAPSHRARFIEACEQAYHFGHGKLTVFLPSPPANPAAASPATPSWNDPRPFSRHLHCAACNIEYNDPSPALFSFNHPLGACPNCKGFGRVIGIDYNLAIPDRSRTLAGGAVKPWQTATGAECQADLVRAARKANVPLDIPFSDLSPDHQRWVVDGEPDYGKDREWPHAWYGIKGYFRYLESKAYKMHVRVLLSRYRAYTACPTCAGQRLQPDALLWRIPHPNPAQTPGSLSIAGFYALTVRQALEVIQNLAATLPKQRPAQDPFALALDEVQARLRFLDEVGVGYLTLDRPTRTLSGGETQRVNLTTCLGTRLVNTLFVLDEPSVGLHARDTDRLIRILQRLRDLGNTVVVVEHEAAVMKAADQIVDIGPGHGRDGGHLTCSGPLHRILDHPDSLTAAYLSGRRRIESPPPRPVLLPGAIPAASTGRRRATSPATSPADRTASITLSDVPAPYRTRTSASASASASASPTPHLRLQGVTRNNLRHLDVVLPLRRLVCLSGVSGSGKTTLVAELLRLIATANPKALRSGDARLGAREAERDPGDSGADADSDTEAGTGDNSPAESRARIEGAEQLRGVLLVDQSPIGRTPRSNPAVYSGAFEPIRDLFAHSETARQRGLNASAFSFNSGQGQCEQCRGAGFEKVEMQFLSDVYIRCPACDGRRYRPHILEITLTPPDDTPTPGQPRRALSIADVLDLTVDEAVAFLAGFPCRHGRRASDALRILQEVGLGYLPLGQPINTLSGGECQRLKLAGHLASDAASLDAPAAPDATPQPAATTLFIFDEPTTGLHFEDVRILLRVFHRLVDAGHSVLIIEHNLDVLGNADWLVDLGPEAGADGGRVIAAGPPEAIAACPESHTGAALRRHSGIAAPGKGRRA